MRVRQRVHITACGSGNFLVIAYKELRKLEHMIIERLGELDEKYFSLFNVSKINIENFYGIEIDDFAVEVAILSLWIAKHQMNQEFKEKFGIDIPLIPLKETGKIHVGNAARIDWNIICPNDGTSEIYLIGNPPYVGSSMQTTRQKEDLAVAFGARTFSKNLDYVSIWFILGADYIRGTISKLAFISTNSVAQGDHVGLLFPTVLDGGIEIGFAYTSFKWENNAKANAGVTVVVIGLRNIQQLSKYLYQNGIKRRVSNINGYLVDANSVYISRRSKALLSRIPRMVRGSQPSANGYLEFSPDQRKELIFSIPGTADFLKRYVGAEDFISDKERYTLWIEKDEDAAFLSSISTEIKDRFICIAEYRKERNDKTTQELARKPWLFKQPAYLPTNSIIVPRVSSENRDYIPMGYLGEDVVISDAAFAVYDAEPWLFSLLTSKIHMAWTKAVGGRMKTDYRYSNTIVYNNFPVPSLSENMKEQLTEVGLRVLDVREYYCERTLAELYDREKMPLLLREAHKAVDDLVDSIYSKRPFATDEERLAVLFDMYEKLAAEEENKPKVKKTTRRRAKK